MTDKATANGPDIQALVEGLARARVALAGDVMLDRFVYGEVSRISPEAPIPVLRVGDEKAMPGGAGNVARNLAALGAKVDFLSVVGDDEAGAELKTALGAEAVTSSLTVVPGRETTVKMRFVAMGQQVLRVDRETNLPLGNAPSEKFIAGLTAALDDKDVLVLSDYGKGVLTPAVLAAAITTGRPLPPWLLYPSYAADDLLW